MADTWKDIGALIIYSDGGITSKVISKSQKYNLTLFCMAAGTDISEHTTAKEGYAYVLEGDGTFRINGEEIPMRPGVLIFIPTGAVHSLSAKGNTAFLLSLS